MEIESFIHGAMCISYSGRCLLSNYFTGRDANQGACTHPCRWKYSIVEETRPGEYMPVYENERGTYIFNSKDLCMIEHMDDVLKSGIDSLKIEGRMKTALYVATVARTYRKAIDDYLEDPKQYEEKIEIMKPDGRNLSVQVQGIYDEDGTPMESAPHPQQVLYVDLGRQAEVYDILRRREETA